MFINNKKTIALTLFLASCTNPAWASVSDQMRSSFNSVINTTTPKSYDTARRGVLSGGQLFIKNETKRTNLVSATPPSFSAGCGGIDIYGGSFSYINADELVETFQAIASNAIGYGVKLAITEACPTCEQIMTSLEKTAQFINDMNIDSCTAAQGLVDAGYDYATTAQADVSAKTLGINSGTMTDLSEAWAWATTEGKSATQELKSNDSESYSESITMNTTWKSLKNADFNLLLGSTEDDTELLEFMMSITGTVIINDSDDSESDPSMTPINGYIVKLTDLINGSDDNSIKIYECNDTDDTGCLDVDSSPSKTITVTGFKTLVEESLTGDSGIINAYANDTEWSTTAKQVLSFPTITGDICLQKIYQAAVHGVAQTIGNQIATLCSERMALEIAYNWVSQNIYAAIASVQNADTSTSQDIAKEKALEVLKASFDSYRQEYEVLSEQSSADKIIDIINAINFDDGTIQSISGGTN